MTHITTVPPVQDSILDELVEHARVLFWKGSVLQPLGGRGEGPTTRRRRRRSGPAVAAYITEVAHRILVERMRETEGSDYELQHELQERDPELDGYYVGILAETRYSVFSVDSARSQAMELTLAQAHSWIELQLNSDPAIKEESDRRYELREILVSSSPPRTTQG